MNGWLDLEGCIEPPEWGQATNTILRLPGDVAAASAVLGANCVDREVLAALVADLTGVHP